MQQLLTCHRCERLAMIDLGLPADVCERCLRALGFPGYAGLTDDHLEVLANAWCRVDRDDLPWEDAVASARSERESRDTT